MPGSCLLIVLKRPHHVRPLCVYHIAAYPNRFPLASRYSRSVARSWLRRIGRLLGCIRLRRITSQPIRNSGRRPRTMPLEGARHIRHKPGKARRDVGWHLCARVVIGPVRGQVHLVNLTCRTSGSWLSEERDLPITYTRKRELPMARLQDVADCRLT